MASDILANKNTFSVYEKKKKINSQTMMTQNNFVIGSKNGRKNVNEILPLTLEFITSQTDLIHFKNLAAFAAKFFLPFWDVLPDL